MSYQSWLTLAEEMQALFIPARADIKAALVTTARQRTYCEKADGEDREKEKGGSDTACLRWS